MVNRVVSVVVLVALSLAANAAAQQGHDAMSMQHMGQAYARGSQVIGVNVRNNANEDLGEIEDLAIDPKTGKIEYAVVSMGGFLDMGDQLYAVPWNALQWRSEEGGAVWTGEDASPIAILNVDKEALQNAPGFPEDNWPNMGDQQWKQKNDSHYEAAQ